MSDTKLNLNKNAKEYIPKHQQQAQQTQQKPDNFNLEAAEFIPKTFLIEEEDVVDEEEKENNEEIDKSLEEDIEKQAEEVILYQELNEDDESDNDKWFPKYKDCTCCKGFVYKCSEEVCVSLGMCFCKAKEDYEKEDE